MLVGEELSLYMTTKGSHGGQTRGEAIVRYILCWQLLFFIFHFWLGKEHKSLCLIQGHIHPVLLLLFCQSTILGCNPRTYIKQLRVQYEIDRLWFLICFSWE